MTFTFLFIGILASILGALPLGASNIAVINTTLKEDAKQAFKVAIAAGIAEVVLSYYALHCNVVVKNFIEMNLWIQVLLLFIILGFGIFLLVKRISPQNERKRRLFRSKYVLGFLLGLLNPPVLVYWIVVFGIINMNDYMLSIQSPLSILFLFFGGVYLGKIVTLYVYSRFSNVLKNKATNINKRINKITGVLLITIALFQAVKLYVF